MRFVEGTAARTQELVLRWSPAGEPVFRGIVRRQWNFSPAGATSEVADYRVDLPGVVVVELTSFRPWGGEARASLAALRLA